MRQSSFSRRQFLKILAATASGIGLTGLTRLLQQNALVQAGTEMPLEGSKSFLPLVLGDVGGASPTATSTGTSTQMPPATDAATATPTSTRTPTPTSASSKPEPTASPANSATPTSTNVVKASTSTASPTATSTATTTNTPTNTVTSTTTSTPTRTLVPAPHQRVVHVRHLQATTWTGQTQYWNYVSQSAVDQMVSSGLQLLTGTTSEQAAWQNLLPNYLSSQTVAVKVSFNNADTSCSDSDGQIDGLHPPVLALIRGLRLRGVAESNICIYDAVRYLPDRFAQPIQSVYPNIRFFGGCRNLPGFSGSETNSHITFTPPTGVIVEDEIITDVLVNANYLINLPIMKAHPIGGVSLGYKNHFGTINNPGGLHTLIDIVQGTARSDYNPMVDFYRNPHIGAKTILTVGDALLAAKQFNQAPEVWETFDYQPPHSLFFSKDPVAIDCVMHDFVKAEIPSTPGSSNRYLELAAQAGQGIFESANPWTGHYAKIDYQYIQLTN
jgi:hypothetical protein